MNRKILYIQYANPAVFPPLEHSSQILARDSWQVMFLGIGALGEANKFRFKSHPQITVRQMPYCPPGWRQKLHYLQFCLWVLVWTLRWQPQWIYASDLFSCPIALVLSFLPGIKVLYHEHDYHGVSSGSFFLQLCTRARKILANRTKLLVLPNQERINQFIGETETKQKAICVWNCPTREEVAPSSSQSHRDSLHLLYQGSIAPSRLPVTVLQAIKKLPQVKLSVIGYETIDHRGYIQELQKIAKQIGISDRFKYLGGMSRHQLLRRSSQYDVGLALMPKSSSDINLQYMVGASNKAFDYLACGLALLVTDLPTWQNAYVEPGHGLTCDPEDEESITNALRWFLEHPAQMRQMRELGRQRIINEWNYERQFEPVKQILEGWTKQRAASKFIPHLSQAE